MDLFKVLNERHSVRAFKGKEIPEEKVKKILDAVNSAPSAGNLQAYEVVKVQEKERRQALAKAALDQGFVAEAPLVLVFFANPNRSSRRYSSRGESLYCVQDATIAAAYAQIAAAALGLASCWVGAFDDATVKKVCNAPEHLKPVAVVPVGYAAEEPRGRGRRFLDELVREEHF